MVKRKADTDREPKRTNNGHASDPVLEKKWTNKQRTLVFASRGITYRPRHLMKDLQTLLPHSKTDNKLDRKDRLSTVNEVCDLKNCNNCIFFEMRKKQDLYMWFSKTPNGPSAKFLVENVHTMDELRMVGNCLQGSRPLLSFDANFDTEPHLMLLKEIFTQTLGTPYYHPKSKPFIDHLFSLSCADNRIWFRNYQIVNTPQGSKGTTTSLVEIGPRFVLNPIRIFSGSFMGSTLYKNPDYESPNSLRREMRLASSLKYAHKVAAKEEFMQRDFELEEDKLADVFK